VKRREFITLLGGVVTVSPTFCPPASRAQQMRRIGVLMQNPESDPVERAGMAAFHEAMQQLNWTEGRNLRIDIRWGVGDPARLQSYAKELVGLKPDLIFASGAPAVAFLQKKTRTLPIVFAQVVDPVGAGFVASLARPGGNTTGFSQYEYAIAVKWLELLKEMAPRITRVAVIHEENPTSAGYFHELESRAPSFGVQLIRVPVRDAADIERAVDAFAREPNGGLITFGGPATGTHRDTIVALAARHRLPTVSAQRVWATIGGLASYGVDNTDLYRKAASYVDRVLKGEKPADLPIQQATKFHLVINLKTAKMLGLDPPISLLARTDEVIE
jgi:putative ABC transport system substrate-binding protein